jgi:hypothetical protein
VGRDRLIENSSHRRDALDFIQGDFTLAAVVELGRAAGLVSGDFLRGLEAAAVAKVFGDAAAAPSGRLPDFVRSRMTTTRAGATVPALACLPVPIAPVADVERELNPGRHLDFLSLHVAAMLGLRLEVEDHRRHVAAFDRLE